MTVDLTRKRILVLSDNDRLARAIQLNLKDCHLEVISLAPGPTGRQKDQAEIRDFDLIVAAMSSINSEPIVALARASLTDLIGQVPLLIISDRPFYADLDHRILHLHFPFDLDMLCDKVQEILQEEPELAESLTDAGDLSEG